MYLVIEGRDGKKPGVRQGERVGVGRRGVGVVVVVVEERVGGGVFLFHYGLLMLVVCWPSPQPAR